MLEGVMLKYGPIYNEGGAVIVPQAMGASEVIVAASGRFVVGDGSGFADIAGDGDTQLIGWVEAGAQTTGSTNGDTVVGMIPAVGCSVVFRIPVNTGTLVQAMIGDSCDLSVASTIQGAQVGTSVEDTVIIVGGDLVNNTFVDVMFNPAKVGVQGVA